MVTVRESEVDGVPCFWVETGRPTLAARLLFRQGMADEPLHESGWLHLLEHMALHGTGSGSLHVNGSVSPLISTFDTHGPAGEVARHSRGSPPGWVTRSCAASSASAGCAGPSRSSAAARSWTPYGGGTARRDPASGRTPSRGWSARLPRCCGSGAGECSTAGMPSWSSTVHPRTAWGSH